jgi:hypothetical protein
MVEKSLDDIQNFSIRIHSKKMLFHTFTVFVSMTNLTVALLYRVFKCLLIDFVMRLGHTLLFFLVFHYGLYGQTWRIEGRVLSEMGEPLAGALVDATDQAVVITDDNGRYTLTTERPITAITVRMLGYFPRRLGFTEINYEQQVTSLDIVLTNQTVVLPEISIGAKREKILMEEDFQTEITDYEFAGENLVLLVRERKRYFVRLMREDGSILHEIRLQDRPKRLFKSCTGGLHLVNQNYANELTINGLHLDTFPRYSIVSFKKIIEPCALQNNQFTFYRKLNLFNKALLYLSFDRESRRDTFAFIIDEAGFKAAMEAYTALRRGASLFISPVHPTQSGITDGFDAPPMNDVELDIFSDAALLRYVESFDQVAHWSWLQSIKKDSVYAPIFQVGDTVLLFDHLNNRLTRYDSQLKPLQTYHISYHRDNKGWDYRLLQDYANKERFYAFFSTQWTACMILGIDPHTGQAQKKYTLDEVPFLARNFKVREGYLYCLAQPEVNTPNQQLLRVLIGGDGP